MDIFETEPKTNIQIQLDNKVYEFECVPVYERYYSDDSAYGVYTFETEAELPNAKPYNSYDAQTNAFKQVYQSVLVGKMQKLNIGTIYNVQAKMTFSKKYNSYNYELISIFQDVPQSIEHQKAFLYSIVTENQANVLLEEFPNIVQDVVNGTDNVDLNRTKGIKEHTWNIIKTKILENYAIADILSLLIPLGITYNKIRRLLDNESNPQLLKQKLINDPYVLVELNGIGFKTADKIALKINPNLRVSKERTTAFLKTHLRSVGDSEGHSWIYKKELENAIADNIVECYELYEAILDEQESMSTFLFVEDDRVGFSYFRETEYRIWDKINEIHESEPLEISEQEIEEGIIKAEKNQGFLFTDEQKNILKRATKNNVVFITGKAGTGKTTLARGLLNIYDNRLIACCALSAKAAKRITEVTGHSASTIHRLLGAIGPYEFTYDELNYLPYEVIFLDESSMVFSGLFWNLIRAIKPGSKLIISGDYAQLPPLNWGNPFYDLIQKDHLNVFYLTKIMRQAEKSGVVLAANQVREGIDPLEGEKHIKTVYGEDQNMFFLFRGEKETLNSIAIKTYLKTIEEVGIDNCCILSSRKDGCLNSSRKINEVIQDLLLDDNRPIIKNNYKKFKLNARVMQIVNSYEKNVFNGDIGTIINIGFDGDGNEFMEVDYPEIGSILYYKEDLNELELAYAYSVHKSQGSEYHTVIVLIDNNGWILLENGLLYTAITRSKVRCLLLSEPAAYDRCIRENKGNNRNTYTKSFEYNKENRNV